MGTFNISHVVATDDKDKDRALPIYAESPYRTKSIFAGYEFLHHYPNEGKYYVKGKDFPKDIFYQADSGGFEIAYGQIKIPSYEDYIPWILKRYEQLCVDVGMGVDLGYPHTPEEFTQKLDRYAQNIALQERQRKGSYLLYHVIQGVTYQDRVTWYETDYAYAGEGQGYAMGNPFPVRGKMGHSERELINGLLQCLAFMHDYCIDKSIHIFGATSTIELLALSYYCQYHNNFVTSDSASNIFESIVGKYRVIWDNMGKIDVGKSATGNSLPCFCYACTEMTKRGLLPPLEKLTSEVKNLMSSHFIFVTDAFVSTLLNLNHNKRDFVEFANKFITLGQYLADGVDAVGKNGYEGYKKFTSENVGEDIRNFLT